MAPAIQPKAAAKVARPAARYRPGKAPVGAAGSLDDFSDSDDDERADDHGSHQTAAPTTVSISDLSSGTAALHSSSAQRKTAGIVIADPSSSAKKISVRLNAATEPSGAQGEDDSSEYETDTSEEDAKPAQARPVFRKPGAPSQPAQKDESSEYETDSDDESSEEEAPAPLAKPIFVPKRARTTIATGAVEAEAAQEDVEAKAEEEAAKRRQEAHDLAAATIKRQLAEKEYQETHATDVDDTDGLDPEAEFEAWRQRELARLQRDREAMDEKRKAQAELDAFRALPESEKERLGRERAKQQAAEKREQRGNPAFLQKYYHKGSFFQDMDILQRDYTEATSSQVDVSKLPKMMQVRNFGAKGRSKWTHLANEDTSKSAMKLDAASACFVCGGPHMKKDCPQRGGAGGSGANRADLGDGVEGSRTWGESTREMQSERRRSRSPKPERKQREDRGEERSSSRRSDRDGKSSSSHRDGREHRGHREHREHRSHRRERSRERQDDRDRDRDRRSRHRDDDQSRHGTERRERRRDDKADRERRHRSDHEQREHHHRRERRDESDSHRRPKRHDDEHTDDLHRKRSRHTSPPPV